MVCVTWSEKHVHFFPTVKLLFEFHSFVPEEQNAVYKRFGGAAILHDHLQIRSPSSCSSSRIPSLPPMKVFCFIAMFVEELSLGNSRVSARGWTRNQQLSTCLGDVARRAWWRKALQRWTHGITQVQGPPGEVKPLRPSLVVFHSLERLQYKESLWSSRWLQWLKP